MKVSEIMTKQVHTIRPDNTLKECISVLKQRNVNGLVVVDGTRPMGIITKADLFKALLPTYGDILQEEYRVMDFEYIEERALRLYDIKVKDFIELPLMTITSDTPVVKAGSLMILRRVKQLPVVDNGQLVGIVTLTDIMNCIAERLK